MNKLFTKIVGVALGLSMAVGAGVAIANNSNIAPAKAGGQVTVTWTATSGALGNASGMTSAGSSTKTGNISTSATGGTPSYSWNYTRTLAALKSGNSDNVSFQGSTWIQLGSNNASESLSFTTSAIQGRIDSISVTAATAGTHTIAITVGGTTYKDSGGNSLSMPTYSGTAAADNPSPSNCVITGVGTSTGAINITITAGTRKALLIRSISVSYTVPTYATAVAVGLGSDSSSTLSEKTINIEKGAGTSNIYSEDLVATVTPNGADDKTVTWSKDGTNASYADLSGATIDDANNEIIFNINTSAVGTFTITASADGAQTANSVKDTITFIIYDPSAAVLDHVAVTGSPVSPQYAGNAFNTTGLTFKAVYDDESEEAITANDIDWDVLAVGNKATGKYTDVASTTVDVEVSLTVLANTLTITIGGSMTKTSYAQNEAWNPAGLTKTGQYADGTSYSGEITWSYSPTTPAGLTVGSNKTVRVTATAASSESTYVDVTVTITEPAYAKTNGIGSGGTFYILNDDSSYGISALNDDPNNAVPGISQVTDNNTLMPFTLTLVGDYTYEITAIIGGNTCYLVNNSTAASSNNNNLRLIQKSEASNTVTEYGWKIEELTTDSGNYTAAQNTTGSTWRYITEYITNHDFRGYTKAYVGEDITSTQDSVLHFVKEGTYSDAIATAILDLSCNNGATAPNKGTWSTIAATTKIANEKIILRDVEATPRAQDGSASSDDDRADAMAKYDYIVGKYGTSNYSDFLGRNPSPIPGAKITSIINNSNNIGVLVITIIVSVIGLTTIGGYFLLRNKKEER